MKKHFWFFTAIVLVLAVTAVGFAANHLSENGVTEGDPEVLTDEVCEEKGNEAAEQIQAEGTFVGLADSHTVEIILADGPAAFTIGEYVAVDEFHTDETVIITYIEENERPEIISIEKQN